MVVVGGAGGGQNKRQRWHVSRVFETVSWGNFMIIFPIAATFDTGWGVVHLAEAFVSLPVPSVCLARKALCS